MEARNKERPTKARSKTRRQVAVDSLLLRMSERVSKNPTAREDFREDVSQIWDIWDGRTPLLWVSWDEGTQVLDCNKRDADDNFVAIMAEAFSNTMLDASEDPRYFLCYISAGEEGYEIREVSEVGAREALVQYYRRPIFEMKPA